MTRRPFLILAVLLFSLSLQAAPKDVPNASPAQGKSFFQKLFGSKDKTEISPDKAAAPDASKNQLKEKKAKDAEPKEEAQPTRGEKKKYSSEIRDAESLYWAGQIDDAEAKVDQVLKANPKNEIANAMKIKIKKTRDMLAKTETVLTDEYFNSAEIFFNSGNNLEASLQIQRAMRMSPNDKKIKKLYDAITQANQKLVDSIHPSKRRQFRAGFRDFLEENFEAADNIFRGLQKTNPEIIEYLSASSAHLIDEKNKERSSVYFAEGVRNIDRQEFRNAQEKLLLAVTLDSNNVEARLLLAQLNIELGS
jgi:hypothetical protein